MGATDTTPDDRQARHRAHYEKMLAPGSGCTDAEREQAKARLEAMGPAPKTGHRPTRTETASGFAGSYGGSVDDVLRSAGFTSWGYGPSPKADPEEQRRKAVMEQRARVDAVPGWWTNPRLCALRDVQQTWSAGEVLEFGALDKEYRVSRMIRDDEIPAALNMLALWLQANMVSGYARREAKACLRQIAGGFVCKGHNAMLQWDGVVPV